MLTRSLNKYDGIKLARDRLQWRVHTNTVMEHSSSIEGGELTDYMSDHKLLKDFAVWSFLYNI
jgi:hypothetical protein